MAELNPTVSHWRRSTRRGWATMLASGLGLLSVLGAVSGCASAVLARQIAQAPNRQNPPAPLTGEAAHLFPATYAQDLRVTVGPPAAELAVAVVEPGNYQLRHGLRIEGDTRGKSSFHLNLVWWPISWPLPTPTGTATESASPEAAAGASGGAGQGESAAQREVPPVAAEVAGLPGPLVPRGTIVLLHGVLVTRETMIHWALRLAQAGYRTVLVDLRGHGASTGEWLTFGATEAADLRQALDELERRGLAAGPVGVLGISYGAVMGLHWAARDARVQAVVALEPYSDARQAIREFARAYGGPQAAKLSDGTFAAAARRMERLGGFRWPEADVLASVARLSRPVLFVHGANDTWIPPAHSERLVAASPAGSRLIMMPEDNHLTLSARLTPLDAEVVAWFEAHLAVDAARR